MSSLNATQADGYYIPPEYIESGAYKKQSLSQFAGSKGHNQYLQRGVTRFELPYDGFCLECHAHVGKGTRFNAHKAHVDDYFSTKIYEFTTRCRSCASCQFKIRTNPRERSFDYVEGIRKKLEEFDTLEAGTAGVIDTEISNSIISSYKLNCVAADGKSVNEDLARLERTAVVERIAQTEFERLQNILSLNEATSKDDAASNAFLRSTYRLDRKGNKRRLREAASIGLGTGIQLSEPLEGDVAVSKEAFLEAKAGDRNARKLERSAFKSVRTSSIFGVATTNRKRRTREDASQVSRKNSRDRGTNEKASHRQRVTAMLGNRQKVLLKAPLHGDYKPSIAIGNSNCDGYSEPGDCTFSNADPPEKEARKSNSAIAALAGYGSDSSSAK